jgi:GTPase
MTTIKKKYILLDSAGIRKTAQREMGAESFAVYHTIEAAWKADVICLVVDGSMPISHQDQVVAGIARETKKGVVVIANKADLVDKEGRRNFERDFNRKFVFLKVLKFIWVSALNGSGLAEVWNNIDEAIESRTKEIDPNEVRKLFNYLMKHRPPIKLRTQKKPVIYDLVFTKSSPPTFQLLIKDRKTLDKNYLKFLENTIRKQFNFQNTGISIKVVEVSRKNVAT